MLNLFGSVKTTGSSLIEHQILNYFFRNYNSISPLIYSIKSFNMCHSLVDNNEQMTLQRLTCTVVWHIVGHLQ